jgi:hypothetical protein
MGNIGLLAGGVQVKRCEDMLSVLRQGLNAAVNSAEAR